MSAQKPIGKSFFLYYNLILLILVVGAFGINGIINLEKLPTFSALVIIHGLIMFLWYGLVVFQAMLIKHGKHNIHFLLGRTSIALAAGIIITGVMMSVESYQRSGDPTAFTVNLPITINFIILYSLAIYRRKYSDRHKRLILFSSIAIIIPALGRIIQAADIDGFLSIPMWLVLLIFPIVYDLRTLKKVHRTTLFGTILIILGIALTVVLLGSPSWIQFLESNIGTG